MQLALSNPVSKPLIEPQIYITAMCICSNGGTPSIYAPINMVLIPISTKAAYVARVLVNAFAPYIKVKALFYWQFQVDISGTCI